MSDLREAVKRGRHAIRADSPARLEALERVYVDGETVESVAADIGVSASTLWRWRREYLKELERS